MGSKKHHLIFEIIEDVKTYSGSKQDEYPLEFIFRDTHYQVSEIIDRWYESGIRAGTPIYNYFKVRTDENAVFIMRHNQRHDSWAVLLS
jgi:hypothetical protein